MRAYPVLAIVSNGCPEPLGRFPRVTHPSATFHFRRSFSFDLHVLSLPPAFVLSQDQTLKLKRKSPSNRGRMDIFRSLRILDVNQSHTHHPERQTTRRTMRTTFTDHCAVHRRPPDKISPKTYERLATKTLAKPPAYPFKQKSFQRASDTKTVFASKQFLL